MDYISAIRKADPKDAGCWIDGHWGQYGVARMVEMAEAHGYADAEVIVLAKRHLLYSHLDSPYPLSDYQHETLYEASDEVEAWLNDNVAPDGYSFGWHDGEFYLWDDETWGDVA